MAVKKTISDYTEAEFLAFVKDLCNFSKRTEAEDSALIAEFKN